MINISATVVGHVVVYKGSIGQLLFSEYSLLKKKTILALFNQTQSGFLTFDFSLGAPRSLIDEFYRYGGHIELIGFKEYYGMPRGHEHDPIYSHHYLRALFGPIFL